MSVAQAERDARTPPGLEALLRALLAESIVLWRVEGTVEAGPGGCVATIAVADGTRVWVERNDLPGVPFRWLVRSRAAGDGPGAAHETRGRPCGSALGVLSAVRRALGVERGGTARIVAASSPA